MVAATSADSGGLVVTSADCAAAAGAVRAKDGQVRAVVDFTVSGGKIMAIELIAGPQHLRAA